VNNSRITNSMMTTRVLSDLQSVQGKLSKSLQQLSSGKQIGVPSDDPYGTTKSMLFRSELSENKQYQRNVAEGTDWQNTTDTALSDISKFTLRARDLLIQGATDTVSPEGRGAIATEIDQLIDSIKTSANTQYAGRYVFGGSQTLTAPYQQGAVDTYAGDTATLKREIGRGVSVDVNIPGSTAVGDGSTGLIAALRKISTDLRTPGSTAQLQTTDLQALDSAHDALTNVQAIVGARTNRLEAAQDRLSQLEATTTKLLSESEDADMAQTITDYSNQQAVYQAALKAGASIIQPSLLDFLR
jgi:flagellar hook-associated protein 3 FlgL